MIIVDGKKIAEKVLRGLKQSPVKEQLKRKKISAVAVEPNQETVHFLKQKQKIAQELGLNFEVLEFPKNLSIKELVNEIRQLGQDPVVAGIIIQLPLPQHLDRQALFNAVPVFKDIDLLSEEAFHLLFFEAEEILPPVIGAIDRIFKEHQLNLTNKSAVVLGAGKLIGIPALAWLAKKGVEVCSLKDWSDSAEYFLPRADILITGLGKPEIVKAECLKNGVCVFDVGYNLVNGKIKGDVDFASVSKKAEIITPVPGGIGPLVVACLFENLFRLYERSLVN
ncbi:MAG: bifunctional 5,10-methylenetetrahydrofolate dehydrogenase/5,10-methenyltetrahydrofolate cyclohydrolase [Patescibacteria group bacterium]